MLFYIDADRICDLTNLENAMLDILVETGVIKDDNRRIVVSKDGSRVIYEKGKVGVEVTIDEIK